MPGPCNCLTIKPSFIDDLWPLFLHTEDDNICDISGDHWNLFYKPKQYFDEFWAHSTLAEGKFSNYQPPIVVQCAQLVWNAPKCPDPETESECDLEAKPYTPKKITFKPLKSTMYAGFHRNEFQKLVAERYVNRKYPWYYVRDNDEYEINITEDMRKELLGFELNLLRNIYKYQITYMIMDLGSDIDAYLLDCWWKFLHYVRIIAIVRDHILARQLVILKNFETILVGENLENTWQEELSESLEIGIKRANDLGILGRCTKPFIYVFSSKRGMTTCDTFKIMHRDI